MINVAIVRQPCDNHRGARAYIEAGTGHHKHTACFEQHCIVCIEWSWEKTCHSVKDGWEISSPPLATHRTSLATPLTLRHYAPLPSYANCPLFSTVCRAFKLKEVFSHPNWRWPVIFLWYLRLLLPQNNVFQPQHNRMLHFLFWSDEASEQVLDALVWLWVQNAEAAKDPLSDLISYNLLLAHMHFLVTRIIIMITDSDVPRHDRFHSCHSCGYPPRRCLFSKHITSVSSSGGAWLWGVTLYRISPPNPVLLLHTVQWSNGRGVM